MNSEKTIINFFFIVLAILLGLLLIFGEGGSGLNQKEPSFERSASGLIYFNNVRRYFYHVTQDTDSGYKLNRLKKLYELDCKEPTLRVFITENNNSSMFWLRFELCDSLLIEKESFIEFNNNIFDLSKMNAEQSYYLGEYLFNSFSKNEYENIMYISNSKEKIALFLDEKERKQLQITLKDYFKLVGRIY